MDMHEMGYYETIKKLYSHYCEQTNWFELKNG